MTIKIGSTIEKLNPADPYKLVSGTDVGGFDELKSQADATKQTLEPLATTDIPAAKRNIADLKKLVDNSIERVSITDNDQLVITQFSGKQSMIQLPKPGSGPDISGLRSEVASVEAQLKKTGTDVDAVKQEFGHFSHQLNDLSNTYTYTGQMAPVIPVDTQYHSYFISLRTTDQGNVNLYMPNPTSGLVDGVLVHVLNTSSISGVVLKPKVGDTISSALSYTVGPGEYALFVRNGNDWFLGGIGGATTKQHPLTAGMISNAVDNGQAPDSGSIKGLADGWWEVPVSNTKLSGRPSGSQGDLVVYKQSIISGDKPGFAVTLAFGNDNSKDPAMWVQYRDGAADVWTKWEKLDDTDESNANIAALTADVNGLKSGNQALIDRLSKLETSLGGIYAPDQIAFDKASNTLIDSRLADFKSELERAGWGPLSNVAGGDRPLPKGIPKIYAEYGIRYPDSIGGVGQFSSTSGSVTLTRSDTSQKRLFVIVPNDENQAEDVTGFSVDGSVAAKWGSTDRTFDSKAYRIFYSPGAYTEVSNTVQVLFGNQEVQP